MDFKQNDRTKKFIIEVESLIQSGIEPSYKTIADKIGWHNNSLSLAMKGKRNVPPEIYKVFLEIFKPVEIHNTENAGLQIALQNQAYIRTIIRGIAELLSSQRKESVMKTLSDMEVAAAQEERLLLERLRKMEGA